MIVAVSGTGLPFDRMVRALADYAGAHPEQRVWVQHGAAALLDGLVGEALIPREELLAMMREAEAVVTHAGSGAIADALRCSHVPVVIARREHFGEHVNDHQLEIAEALASEGRIIHISAVDELPDAIERAAKLRAGVKPKGTRLKRAVRSEVERLAAQPPARRTSIMWALMRVATRLVPMQPGR